MPTEPATIGDNGLTMDDVIIAASEMVKLKAERVTLNAKISAARKEMKLRGITLGVLDRKIKMLDWTPSEQKAEAETDIFYAKALHMPAGDLLDMFEERTGEGDPEVETRKWFNVGRKNGLVGIGWPDEAPEGCPPECAQSYGEGVEDGQRALMAAIKKRAQSVLVTAPTEDEAGE